jgi:hypothetical protein
LWLERRRRKKKLFLSVFCFKTIDQLRLNYEEQNQYKIRIQFSNQSNLFEQIFSIDIKDINEPPSHLQCSSITYHQQRKKKREVFFYLDQTGFCTALDEDFNQTLTFQIKTTEKFHYEISCTDNGQPPLSVK